MKARWLLLGLLLGGCSRTEEPAAAKERTSDARDSSASPAAAAVKPQLVRVPAELSDGRNYVRKMLEHHKDGKVLIYVGATWCEPCTRFHDALASGALDHELANAVFLEFDLDQHQALLSDADMGCKSKLVPLFARPNPDGTCSSERTEGGVKGERAVSVIVPRLAPLLR